MKMKMKYILIIFIFALVILVIWNFKNMEGFTSVSDTQFGSIYPCPKGGISYIDATGNTAQYNCAPQNLGITNYLPTSGKCPGYTSSPSKYNLTWGRCQPNTKETTTDKFNKNSNYDCPYKKNTGIFLSDVQKFYSCAPADETQPNNQIYYTPVNGICPGNYTIQNNLCKPPT